MKRQHQYSSLVKHHEHGRSDFDHRMNITVTNSLGKQLRTSVSFLEMKAAYEELIQQKQDTYNSSEGLDILGAPHKNLAEFNEEFKDRDITKPSVLPQYRKMNLVDMADVRNRLKKFRHKVNEWIQYNTIDKMGKKIEKLIAEDFLFNDILFVMLSNKFLEYQNQKAKHIVIGGMKEKEFIFFTRKFLVKILKAIKLLELCLGREDVEVVPSELNYFDE